MQLAARVEDEQVAMVTVERIVESQGVSFDEALERAIFDALCAREARAKNLDRASAFEIATLLARQVFDEEMSRARSSGPPTASELAAFAAEHRLEVARPEVVVVVHALVPLAASATSEEQGNAERTARDLAARLRAAAPDPNPPTLPNYTPRPGLTLARLPTDPEFAALQSAAREVGGATLTFEQLPPFERGGSTVVDDANFPLDPSFVAGAFALSRRGQVSDPVRTPFGFHVIVLLDRIAALELDEDTLRRTYSEAIFGLRARKALDATLASLRVATSIEVDPAVDEALGRVDLKGSP